MPSQVSDIVELSCPGKAFVAGEYAVLERGEPALVLAVDRRLHLTLRTLRDARAELFHRPTGAALQGELTPSGISWRAGIPGELRFAARAAALAARLCAEEHPTRGFQATFEDEFALRGRKLGLGGSAAASVLAVRATCAAQGRELSPHDAVALAAASHWVEQGGRGSGADVAACALGGLLEVRTRHAWGAAADPLHTTARSLLDPAPVEAMPVKVPDRLRFLLAFTGMAADSRALVGEVLAFAQARPGRWRRHVQDISAQEGALRVALESGDEPGALDAVRRAAAAMAALGVEAQAPIVTPDLARACAVASSAGAAGKPSGAGGGDCAVVLAWGDAADRAQGALEVAGFDVLRVTPAIP